RSHQAQGDREVSRHVRRPDRRSDRHEQVPGAAIEVSRCHLMLRPLVYIASPYTKGDPCVNARFQSEVFDQMVSDGICLPYIPLWSHYQHTLFPRPYADWI